MNKYTDWQQRVIDERDALETKCDALSLFLDSDACEGLELVDLAKLTTQIYFMTRYFATLEDRISSFIVGGKMTTTVKVEHISGNKAVQVTVMAQRGDTKVSNDFTILGKEESAEFLLYEGQDIMVGETGEFLD